MVVPADARLQDQFLDFVLTVVTVLFVPLTFIAGIHGMNFEFMPELGWRWSYFIVLGAMASLAIGLLIVFRRQGWI